MNPKRRQRLLLIIFVMLGTGIAIGLASLALRESINLFYSPTQIHNGEAPPNREIRAGGLVVAGSVNRDAQSLKVSFDISDTQESVTVEYEGILPDLFREGQGIVALGKVNANGVVVARQVLAKHDEKYMPPEVKKAIEAAGHPEGSTY